MTQYYLYPSNIKTKKYTVKFINEQTRLINTIHFGATGMSDYTLHKDDRRKTLYIKRHINDNINDLNFAGCWSMNLLWNKKTLAESIKDMEKRFGIEIINPM